MDEGIAHIFSGGIGWVKVIFDYDPELKDALRDVTGRGNYRWEPEEKAWYYRDFMVNRIKDIFAEFDYEVFDHRSGQGQGQGRQNSSNSRQKTSGSNPWIAVFDQVPNQLARKLYHAATLVLHPDQGGDNEAMKQLNTAWDAHQRKAG